MIVALPIIAQSADGKSNTPEMPLFSAFTSFIIISEVVALKKKYIIIISAIVCVLLLLSGFLIFRSCDKDEPNTPSLPQDSNAVDWNGQQQLPGASGAGKICIPGFDSLVFLAGQTKQKVNFYNPAVNKDRLFLMTLYIDNSVYWKSGYCPSGSGYYDIELSEPLPEGEYSGYLKIQVFKPDGKEVNGAKVAFNLLVTSEVQE